MSLVNSETGEVPTHSPTPYQLMPGLTDEERASLRLDIEKKGIRVPIDVDEDDNILDGHHRAWIAAELGIPCPRRLVSGLTEEQKREHAVSVNVFRRNLTREQRRELVARLRADGMSQQAIANAVGTSQQTVSNDLRDVTNLGNGGSLPEEITDSLGRRQPAKKPSSAEKIEEAKAKHPVEPPNPKSRAGVEARVAKAKEMAAAGATSRQIAAAVGISPEGMADFRNRHGIEVPADAVVGKTRLIDSNRVVSETVYGLEGTVMALDLVEWDQLDRTQVEQWAISLNQSLSKLRSFTNRLKEMAR